MSGILTLIFNFQEFSCVFWLIFPFSKEHSLHYNIFLKLSLVFFSEILFFFYGISLFAPHFSSLLFFVIEVWLKSLCRLEGESPIADAAGQPFPFLLALRLLPSPLLKTCQLVTCVSRTCFRVRFSGGQTLPRSWGMCWEDSFRGAQRGNREEGSSTLHAGDIHWIPWFLGFCAQCP